MLGASEGQLSSAQATFQKLGRDFQIHKDVVRHMVISCQMETLEDFRFYFSKDDDIATMVGRVRPSGHIDDKDYLDKGIAISRVRQAWDGIKREWAKRDRSNEDADVVDLDEPLPAQDLRNLKKAHWKRYKGHYPAHIMLSLIHI